MIRNNLIQVDIDMAIPYLKSIPDLKDKRVLITGASGLIGVHLTEFFKRFCYNVFVSMKHEPPPYLQDIFEGTNQIIGDIVIKETFDKIPDSFDYIIHAAGYATPAKFMEDKYATLKIGVEITNKLLEKLTNTGNFLFVSSSEVYGGVPRPTEEYILSPDYDNPRICYISAKLAGEAAVNMSLFNAKSVRVCNAYGPGVKMNDERVLNHFINQGLVNKEIRMRDHGQDHRDYCYITDVIIMMLNIMFHGKSKLYNVGSDSRDSFITISQLAGEIAMLTGSGLVYPQVSVDTVGAPKYSAVSIEKYITEFDYHKPMPLIIGLRETAKWHNYLIEYVQQYYNFYGEVLNEN